MTADASDSITLHVHDRSVLDSTLDSAVTQLTAKAKAQRQGILVTRTSPIRFVVSVSPDVPYGTTRELLDWS